VEEKTIVEDLTDYSTQDPEENTENPYIDVEVKISNSTEFANADNEEGIKEDSEEDKLSSEDALVAESGYEWKDLIDMGLSRLYEADLDANEILTMHKTRKSGAKELLAKYLIKVSSETEAYNALVAMTEVIFPEGFAIGFSEGYSTATIEQNDKVVDSASEDSTETTHNETLIAVHKKISDIEAELDLKESELVKRDEKIDELTKSLVLIQAKHEKDSKRLANQYTMIKYLMYKQGIIDEAGNVDKNSLDQIRKEAAGHTYKKATV
jgi:hypothetical protein